MSTTTATRCVPHIAASHVCMSSAGTAALPGLPGSFGSNDAGVAPALHRLFLSGFPDQHQLVGGEATGAVAVVEPPEAGGLPRPSSSETPFPG